MPLLWFLFEYKLSFIVYRTTMSLRASANTGVAIPIGFRLCSEKLYLNPSGIASYALRTLKCLRTKSSLDGLKPLQ